MTLRIDQALRELAAAIGTSDWERSLVAALAAWRETRAPQLADLIERLGVRCGGPLPPAAPRTRQAWWVEHARDYDPIEITALVDHIDERLRANDLGWYGLATRWPERPFVAAIAGTRDLVGSNWVDRIAAITSWPDDPRVARTLATWLTGVTFVPHLRDLFSVIADRLAAIADVRVRSRLAAFLADPRSPPEQCELVARVESALDHVPPAPADLVDQVAALADALSSCSLDLEPLWRQVWQHPHDPGPRGVLADALVANQDPRGELIALQLAIVASSQPDKRQVRRVTKLLDLEWTRFLGDLTPLVVREGTQFRSGMLEVIRVGHPFTPNWAWNFARGHRELRTVHTVRPCRAPAAPFADLVVSLEHLCTLQINEPSMAAELHQRGARLPIENLELDCASRSWSEAPLLLEVLRSLASVAPAVQRILLHAGDLSAEVIAVVRALPAMFSSFVAIEVVVRSRLEARSLAAELREIPFVTVTEEDGGRQARGRHEPARRGGYSSCSS